MKLLRTWNLFRTCGMGQPLFSIFLWQWSINHKAFENFLHTTLPVSRTSFKIWYLSDNIRKKSLWTTELLTNWLWGELKLILCQFSNALWFIDHCHKKIENNGCPIPQVLKRFHEYSDYKKSYHVPPTITSEKLNEHCDLAWYIIWCLQLSLLSLSLYFVKHSKSDSIWLANTLCPAVVIDGKDTHFVSSMQKITASM
jgi:hypothetical protein